ncbi:unnamed protein product [Gadus morhua 'NCC']
MADRITAEEMKSCFPIDRLQQQQQQQQQQQPGYLQGLCHRSVSEHRANPAAPRGEQADGDGAQSGTRPGRGRKARKPASNWQHDPLDTRRSTTPSSKREIKLPPPPKCPARLILLTACKSKYAQMDLDFHGFGFTEGEVASAV